MLSEDMTRTIGQAYRSSTRVLGGEEGRFFDRQCVGLPSSFARVACCVEVEVDRGDGGWTVRSVRFESDGDDPHASGDIPHGGAVGNRQFNRMC